MVNHEYIAELIQQATGCEPILNPSVFGGWTATAGIKHGWGITYRDGPERDTKAEALLALCETLDLRLKRNTTRQDCPLFDHSPAQKGLF